MPRSISSASRTPTGVNSILKEAAPVWIAAKPPDPAGTEASRMTATASVIADQSAGGDELAPFVHGRNGMTSGQSHESLAYDLEPCVGCVDDGAGLAFDHGREGHIDLALIRRIENDDVLPDRLRRREHLLGVQTARVDDERNQLGVGHELTQQMKALRPELGDEAIHAGGIAPGTVEAGDKADLDGIAAAGEYDRNIRGSPLCRQRRRRIIGDEDGNVAANQIGGQSRQQVFSALREA